MQTLQCYIECVRRIIRRQCCLVCLFSTLSSACDWLGVWQLCALYLGMDHLNNQENLHLFCTYVHLIPGLNATWDEGHNENVRNLFLALHSNYSFEITSEIDGTK